MTKTIMILAIAAAFVAGTISTATFVSAAPPENNPGKSFDAILQKLDEIIATLTGTDAEVANIEGKLDGTVASKITEIDTEVDNIEGKLDNTNTGLAAIKTAVDGISTGGIPASTQTQIDNIESDVGMIKTTVGDIDTEVTNIEGKLDGTTSSFVSDIKTETDKIQMVKDNQYVPFSVVATGLPATCDTAGGPADNDGIGIDSAAPSGGHFVVTSILLRPSGVDDPADEIRVSRIFVNSNLMNFFPADPDLTGSIGIPLAQISSEVMGTTLKTGGSYPHQIVAFSGPASPDIRVGLTCIAGSSSDIIFPVNSIVVSGWKQADDTITVAYREVF